MLNIYIEYCIRMYLSYEVNTLLHSKMGNQIRPIFFVICVCLSNVLYAQEVISLLYNERAPYQMTNKTGAVSGLTATPILHAFNQANIQMVWKLIPANRQLLMIKENQELVCGVGWFINDNRKQFAKFSKPIYRDKPTVAIANKSLAEIKHDQFIELIQNKKITFLLKEKYSYGEFIDKLFLLLGVKTVTTTAENIGMVKMIKAGRADLMLSSEEEASYFFSRDDLDAKEFTLMRFKDMPMGEFRHLMCSKKVSDTLMQKINDGLPIIP